MNRDLIEFIIELFIGVFFLGLAAFCAFSQDTAFPGSHQTMETVTINKDLAVGDAIGAGNSISVSNEITIGAGTDAIHFDADDDGWSMKPFGIGTKSPANLLHLYGYDNIGLRIEQTIGSGSIWDIGDGIGVSNTQFSIRDAKAGTNPFVIQQGAASNTMRILSTTPAIVILGTSATSGYAYDVKGKAIANAWDVYSSKDIKNSIRDVDGNIVSDLSEKSTIVPRIFKLDTDVSQRDRYGFIAEEVPSRYQIYNETKEIVGYDFVGVVSELSKQIISLQKRIAVLEAK